MLQSTMEHPHFHEVAQRHRIIRQGGIQQSNVIKAGLVVDHPLDKFDELGIGLLRWLVVLQIHKRRTVRLRL